MKNSPSCGCCTPSGIVCCPGGKPTTGYLVDITGFTGFSCTFKVLTGGIWVDVYFDCSQLNGTLTMPNSAAACDWVTTSPVTGITTGGSINLTVDWLLNMYFVAADKYVRIYGTIANTTDPTPIILGDAATLDNTACASISALVIELQGDALQPGSECCAITAGVEAEVTAF